MSSLFNKINNSKGGYNGLPPKGSKRLTKPPAQPSVKNDIKIEIIIKNESEPGSGCGINSI